jgi:methyl-accepting chemotaxis protein
MQLSISKKIVAITIASLLLSSIVALCISYVFFERLLEERTRDKMRSIQLIVTRLQQQDEQRVLQASKMVSSMPELVAAMRLNETAKIKEVAKTTYEQLGIDAVTITDAKGIVLARGHSSKAGDDISKRPTMQRAFQGLVKVGILFDPSAVVPYTIRCDAPIYADQKTLIGVLSLAVSIGTEAHLNSLAKLSGMEFTLYSGDIRTMTTLKGPDGKLAVGSKLEDALVLDRVLQKGEALARKMILFGMPYNTVYWPIKDMDGKIIGMWFTGENAAEQEMEKKKAVLIAGSCVMGVALLLVLLASVLGGRVALPIRRATDYAVQVADGKLDAPLVVAQSRDEVGLLVGALQSMVRTLQERISEAESSGAQARAQAQQAHEAKLEAEAAGEEARKSHEAILSAAAQLENAVKVIRHASADLTECIRQAEADAGRQADYIAASASAMEQMSNAAGEVSANAVHAMDFSLQTKEKAARGANIVEEVISSIQEVQNNSVALKADMTELSTHAKAISQIMDVISDIAGQTNLLALNAAIEAARAGDAGRGFAVVADEVRKLAEKTMASTGDVSQAVSSIHNSMGISMEELGITVTNIEQATERAAQSGTALREIVTMADDAARQVEGIVAACEQQVSASEHVRRGIAEVNAIAGHTHESMETASRDIADLAVQTDKLGELVTKMKRV